MNFRKNENSQEEENFQIAPFIDIVFLLLIFFLLTARLEAEERQINLDLPSASEGKLKWRLTNELVINVNQSGRVTVRDYEYKVDPKLGERSLTHLLMKMAKGVQTQSVIIRADGRTPHKYVMGVLNACRKARMKNVSIATLAK